MFQVRRVTFPWGPFKKDITAKMAIFGPSSPHVTINHYFRIPPQPTLRIQETETIWGHFKNSDDTRDYENYLGSF